MNSQRVSIVMPVKDGEDTLHECLQSIREQTLDEYELLAIDDHSSDRSRAILEEAASGDARIRVLAAEGRGLVPALQQGLREARAPLIARMDCDDRMLPARLALQVEFLDQHPDVDLVASRVRIVSAAPLLMGISEYVRWQDRCESPADLAEEIYVEAPFVHPSVTFRTAVVRHLGGYREGHFPEDYDLWLRMAAAGCRMAKLPHELLEWRDRPSRTSRTDGRYGREAFDELRAGFLALDPRVRGPRPVAFWGAGRLTRRRSRRLIERGVTPVAWIDLDPRKIGNVVEGRPVKPREWLRRQERPFVLVYVASHGAQESIGTFLESIDYRRGSDFLMVG